MKILLDHTQPFFLVHGGMQTQVEQTYAALQAVGLEVEWVRWWDDSQTGDIIHYFGRPYSTYIRYAQAKGFRVVTAELLTGLGSRPPLARALQRTAIRLADGCLPEFFTGRMAWESFRLADACVALTPWEKRLMQEMFGAPAERVWVVPNGVERAFLDAPPVPERGPWLVCMATITERKRVLELAAAAIAARTPVWIIGKPYAESDAYYQRFLALARQSPEIIRYEGPISERAALARIYREARGFVLLSTMESLSLSALEAAACECPLLLSDLPWATGTFGAAASYCPVINSVARTAACLRGFYAAAPRLPIPPKPKTWVEVGELLKELYTGLLSTSR